MQTQSPPSERAQSREIRLEFTGSGSEYFRIWVVNLLLTLCTLGLYYPWAKVRKLRYFYGNTLVAGEPLGFHGDPKKMFKGYALAALLFAFNWAASEFSPTAGFLSLLVIAALWPALLKSSMQFRIANSSWRALRLRFTGDLAGAYRAVLPLYIPTALLIVAVQTKGPGQPSLSWAGTVILALVLGTFLLWPCLLWNLKKYQHTNYALGEQQTGFTASIWCFYWLALKVIGIYLYCVVLLLLIVIGWNGIASHSPVAQGKDPKAMAESFYWVISALIALFVAVYIYAQARTQDLLWNHTASAQAQFHSRLRYRSLFWLNLKNWLFMLLTLGLYWPFAAVANRRLRLQAVSLTLDMNPEQLSADRAQNDEDAAGDAAGDFLGFDIGL